MPLIRRHSTGYYSSCTSDVRRAWQGLLHHRIALNPPLSTESQSPRCHPYTVVRGVPVDILLRLKTSVVNCASQLLQVPETPYPYEVLGTTFDQSRIHIPKPIPYPPRQSLFFVKPMSLSFSTSSTRLLSWASSDTIISSAHQKSTLWSASDPAQDLGLTTPVGLYISARPPRPSYPDLCHPPSITIVFSHPPVSQDLYSFSSRDST